MSARRLPALMFVVGSQLQGGPGERRDDCAHADACTTAWARYALKAHDNGPAHCAARCPSYEASR